MLRWKLKACTRCAGDVYIDRDADGWFEQCLQCSYRRQLRDIADFGRQPVGVGVSDRDIDWTVDDDVEVRHNAS